MNFTADKQTLEDLNLMNHYRPHALYGIFNKVKTTGGEKLLQQMFQSPLTNAEDINTRSNIFNYFQKKLLSFPFSNKEFAITQDYLKDGGGKNYIAVFVSLWHKKLLGGFVRDERYETTKKGLQHIIALLKKGESFLNHFNIEKVGHPYYEQINVLRNIFKSEQLQLLLKSPDAEALHFLKMVRYDHLFRNKLCLELTRIIDIFCEIDLFIAVASVSHTKGFSYALALEPNKNVFTASDLRHPAIDKGIGNTISLHQQNNLVFLTGANMSGKSTFMKSFGIAVYLAHMGFPVAAKEMVFSVKEGLWSSINVPDNLSEGLSHFYAEVLRVKKVAEEVGSGKNLVVIFDELFKGTNVKDAYDATLAVTAAFAQYSNCLFIISTHIVEVGEALQQQKNIQFQYLPTLMKGRFPYYTYKIEQGISNDRHGMMIIENEGILDIIKEKHTIQLL